MQSQDDKFEQQYQGSVYSSIVDQPSVGMTPVHGSVPLQGLPNAFLKEKSLQVNVFRLNSKALFITVSVISLIVIAVISVVALKSPKPSTAPNSQYVVGALPLNGVQSNKDLSVGKLDQLTINGLLQANNTIILNPGSAPTSAKAGQIYYDEVTNEPFYYNGTKFVSLNPAAPVASTSLGGLTGAIGLGQGLTIAGNQLGLVNSFTSGLVTGLTGAVNQIKVSGATGNIKLSLPQDIAVTSSPTFGGVSINGNSTFAGDSNITGNHTIHGQLSVGSSSTYSGTATFDATAKPIGAELVTNGDFTLGTLGWTLGTDVTYNPGTKDVTNTSVNRGYQQRFYTTFNTVMGNTYDITFNVSNSNSSMCIYTQNNSNGLCSYSLVNGKQSQIFVATYTGTDTIYFDDWNGVLGDTWTIDNVSIKQIKSISNSPALKVVGYDGSSWLSLGNDILGNTALGQGAFQNNTTGNGNSAFGTNALNQNTTGFYNIATGTSALQSNTTGNQNIATGVDALLSNTTGSQNIATGNLALQGNTTGSLNTATGSYALYDNTTGYQNIATGYLSLFQNTTGSNNTALGDGALQSNTTGSSNTANGTQALQSNTTGSSNTANGTQALYSNTTGSNNVALGNAAGHNLTTGSNNLALGYNTAFANPSADNQLQIGAGISGDLALGTLFVQKLDVGGNINISGNSAYMYNGYNVITAQPSLNNYFFGGAGNLGMTGSNNIATGYQALLSITTGGDNIALGTQALYSNTTGFQNTALGTQALYSNTTGRNNAALGIDALSSNTTGNSNTALGIGALQLNTTGNSNTALGLRALGANTTGSNNSAFGYDAGYNLTTGSNNIALGLNTHFASATADNQLQIGAGISGDLALGTLILKSVTNLTTAFQIQNTATETLFTADTAGMVITIAGTTATFASLTLDNAHFKSTQTNAPIIGTPANCGVTPTAIVTAGSTDTAGSFVINAGTGSPTTCNTVLTFNKAYGAAPKSIVITSTKAVGLATAERVASVAASSSTAFAVNINNYLTGNVPAASEVDSFYYFIIE